MTNQVTLTGYIVVPNADLEAVLRALPTHIQLTQAESGCMTFNVTQNPQDPTRFEVYEVFSDQAAFEAHQQRVRQSDWGTVTQNVARHYEITGQ